MWSVPPDDLLDTAHRLRRAGLKRWHWDFSDGTMAAAGGFTAKEAHKINFATGIPGETHLMTQDVLDFIPEWTPICQRIIVHAEVPDSKRAVELILSSGCTPIVALSPETSLNILDDLPPGLGVLVMSVTPGQAGSKFHDSTYERLDALRHRAELGVDGSVNPERATRCFDHGASWVVSGTSLCESLNPSEWILQAEDYRDQVWER